MTNKKIPLQPKTITPADITQSRYTDHYRVLSVAAGQTNDVEQTGRQFTIGFVPCAIRYTTNTGLSGTLQPYGTFNVLQPTTMQNMENQPFSTVTLSAISGEAVDIPYEITSTITHNPVPYVGGSGVSIENSIENPVPVNLVTDSDGTPLDVELSRGQNNEKPLFTSASVDSSKSDPVFVSIVPAPILSEPQPWVSGSMNAGIEHTLTVGDSDNQSTASILSSELQSNLTASGITLDEFYANVLDVTVTTYLPADCASSSAYLIATAYRPANGNLFIGGLPIYVGDTVRIYPQQNTTTLPAEWLYSAGNPGDKISFYVTWLLSSEFVKKWGGYWGFTAPDAQ